MRTSRVGVAVLTAGVVLGSACSSSKSGPSPTAAVQAAVTASMAARTVQERVTAVTPTSSGQTTSKASGGYSFTAREGTFNVDTGDILGKVDVLVKDSNLYINLPASIAQTLAKGKTWVSADLNNPPQIPATGNLTVLAAAADPSRSFQLLADGMTTASKVGPDQVDGQPVTHYRATLDLNKAKAAAPAATQPLVQSEISLLGPGVSGVTDDVYLGTDGKIVRLVGNVDFSGGKAAPSPKTTGINTADYSGYGSTVMVNIPPGAQVVDAAKLLGQISQ